MPVFNFGGGSGLSLKVNAYTAFPATAAEHTVGILSAVPVTRYVFASAAPETGLSEGLTWVKTGSASNTPIPVSAKNSAYLYPVAARQYQNGAWTDVEAKCFQAGAWQLWAKRLYTSESGSGGTPNVPWSTNSYAAVDNTNGYLRIGKTSAMSNRGFAYTANRIDVTDYRTLWIEYMRDGTDASSGGGIMFGLSDVQASGADYVVSAQATSKTRVRKSLDISSVTGERYVQMNNVLTGEYVKLTFVYNVWLEG